MSRDLDPRFSTALRDELTRRADALDTDPAAEPTLPARRQWIVVAVTAAVLLLVIGGLLTAYHRPAPPANGSIPSSGPSTLVEGLADPLTEVEDAGAGSDPYVLLHVAGTGPSSYRITVPSGATEVSAYLSCTTGSFRMDVGGKAFRSECSRQTVTARIPVGTGERDVRITVDAGTRFIALALPWAEGTTFSMLTVGQAPTSMPYPSVRGTVLAQKRGTSSATVSGRLSRAVGVYTITVTCQGVGLRVSTSDGSTTGPDGLCATDRLLRTSFSVGADGGLRQRGRLSFLIEPVGRAYWTVTFTAAD